jgi:LmbE family N-acetylglucosaminyl deacetylase
MIALPLERIQTVLCLGAHSDDIEIGCGGTLLNMMQAKPDLKVFWVVLSGGSGRTREARLSAKSFLRNSGKGSRVITRQFPISHFPFQGSKIKRFFETLKRLPNPDLIFTHYRDDRHQDHRMVSDLTWNTFRDHLILEYEVPKYDGDLGQPNVFVRLPESVCREKVETVCKMFKTQSNKHWFTPDTFLGLMRLRGIECVSTTRYAEAFYARKILLGKMA